jgi:hypothetical protein
MPQNNCYMNGVFTILLISYGIILTSQIKTTQVQSQRIDTIYVSHKNLENSLYNDKPNTADTDTQLILDKQQLTIKTILFNNKQLEERIENLKLLMIKFYNQMDYFKSINDNSSKKLEIATDIITLYQNITISQFQKNQLAIVNVNHDLHDVNARLKLVEDYIK